MAFGDNLRRLRQDRGLTQGDLAKITGMKLGHISRLENNDSDPRMSTIYKIMDALECSANTLLVDVKEVGIDSITEMMIERTRNLPEDDKRSICSVIDAMCIANGVNSVFSNGYRKWYVMNKPINRINDELRKDD